MYPSDRKYTKNHEWVTIAGGEARVGITQYAQEQLGEDVYVELPENGRSQKLGQTIVANESDKAVT